MLQQEKPDDYVIATGQTHSVREFVEAAFGEVGYDWRDYVRTDPAFLRATEVHQLLGDATNARKQLGWVPTVQFNDLVKIMVQADFQRLSSPNQRDAFDS